MDFVVLCVCLCIVLVARKVSYPIYEEIRKHHRPQGGTQVLCIAGMGKGKTTWLLHRARDQLKRGEVCIWRGRDTAQWTPFLTDDKFRVKLWFRKGDSYTFIKIPVGDEDGVEVDLSELDVEVGTFQGQQRLIRGCKSGVLNVVYVKNRKWWLRFFTALIERLDNRWVSLFVDEFDDIVQEYPKGEDFYIQQKLKDDWKDLRKRFISVYATTHNISDIDNRVAKKFQYFAYLPASKPVKRSRVYKGTIDSLSMGEGIIEGGGRFQPFGYKEIPFPSGSLLVRPTTS
jgi:hypothetical protein